MTFFNPSEPRTITIRLIDAANGRQFAQSQLPPDQLPESFEAQTTLHLNDGDWSVVEARPMTAAEFLRSGELTLILSKVSVLSAADLKDVLFSLPTIENTAPPPPVPHSTKLGLDTLEIHEDDWRQIEWISSNARQTIEAEMDSIRTIYREHRRESGFAKCHLRQLLPAPLQGVTITLAALREAFAPHANWLDGLALRGVAGLARDAFALRLRSSIELFGHAAQDVAACICFGSNRVNSTPNPDPESLARFAANHGLLLVDWCRAQVIESNPADYLSYFAAAPQ